MRELSTLLTNTPTAGTPLGNDAYKIRLAIKSKNTGKSGGARVITYVVTEEKDVYLMSIYDKADIDSVDDKTLRKIIQSIRNEK